MLNIEVVKGTLTGKYERYLPLDYPALKFHTI